jgi:hypothetical protein
MERQVHPKRASRKPKFSRPKKTANQTAVTIPRGLGSYKLVTDQMRIALKYSGTVSTSVNVFGVDTFGVAGPGLRIPKYWGQFYNIYKYAYIEAVEFKFQISESNNRPLRVVLAESNTQDVTPTNFLELAQSPRAIQKQVIAGGNQSVVILNKKTNAKAILGHVLEDDDQYWNTVAAGPTASILPVVALGYEPIVALSVCQMNYMVEIVYHLKYFALNHL